MIGLLLAVAAGASLPTRTVELPGDLAKPILVQCPVEQTTRIVLPERVSRLTASAGARESLGLTVEQYGPFGTMAVRPTDHPVSGRVVVRSPSRTLVLQIESSATGVASEIRFTLPALAQPAARPPAFPARTASAESPAQTPADPPEANPAPVVGGEAAEGKRHEASGDLRATPAPVSAASEPTTAHAGLDLEGLLAAQAVGIGRREGLPGQKQVVLADALRGEKWVWFRFVVRGGAGERVVRVHLGDVRVETHTAQPEGKDLKVVVQVSRSQIGRRSRIRLSLASGATYTFPLTSASFTAFLKSLFR